MHIEYTMLLFVSTLFVAFFKKDDMIHIQKWKGGDMVVYDLKCKGFAINKSSLSRYENGKM